MNIREYEKQILEWRAWRYNELVREDGWLALAGLFWLNNGRSLVGSNPMCEITLPEHAPTFLGIIEVKGKTVRLNVAQGVKVEVNGRPAQKAILRSSSEPNPTFITWGHMRMVLHEHAGRYALRIWDNQRSQRHSLPPLKWFPINKHFRLNARYRRYPDAKISGQSDTLGDLVEDRMDGYLSFNFEGEKHKLDVTELKDHRLFIKFKDLTSGKETYPASRYCYTAPAADGKVVLDFNYAYSPPCAFTEYVTCIFAPPQNHLPFRVEAGEIYRG